MTSACLFKKSIHACLFAAVLIALHALPCFAATDDASTKPQAHQISWNDTPAYLQEQIKNTVLNCTEGTLTPDKARIFEYATPEQPKHYVYDYSAWKNHPLIPNCQNSLPLCGEAGCLMFAYTQIKPDVFKQSLRTYILHLAAKKISENDAQGNIVEISGFEMEQSKHACRLLDNGNEPCILSFTWKDNKFTYFGLGSKDNEPPIEPPHQKALPEQLNKTE